MVGYNVEIMLEEVYHSPSAPPCVSGYVRLNTHAYIPEQVSSLLSYRGVEVKAIIVTVFFCVSSISFFL